MITISLSSSVPLHDQLVSGLRDLIASGVLHPGSELPPVRQLAADLGINLNTVARAYRELTEAGLLASVRGRGTTVIATVAKATGEPGADPNRIESRLVAALRDAKLAGWDCEAVQTLVALHIERLWKPV